ncbi:MAG: Hpt domain-containing protein [Paracoccaceae bacterium]
MIDWDRVTELRTEIGEEGFAEVVELFLDEVEGVVMKLHAAMSPEQIEDDLHFLKGGAWNLGFSAFGAYCEDGERKATIGQAAAVDLTRVADCYFESKAEFLAGLERQEPGRASTAA